MSERSKRRYLIGIAYFIYTYATFRHNELCPYFKDKFSYL